MLVVPEFGSIRQNLFRFYGRWKEDQEEESARNAYAGKPSTRKEEAEGAGHAEVG